MGRDGLDCYGIIGELITPQDQVELITWNITFFSTVFHHIGQLEGDNEMCEQKIPIYVWKEFHLQPDLNQDY